MENTIYNRVDDTGEALEDGLHYVLYYPEIGVVSSGPIVEYSSANDEFYLVEGSVYQDEVYDYHYDECAAIRLK
jgi:hypothetical protein